MAAAGEMAIGKAAGAEADIIAAAGKTAIHGGSWGDGDWEGGNKLLFFSKSIFQVTLGLNTSRVYKKYCYCAWRQLGRMRLGRRRAARHLEWRRMGRWLCVAAAGKAVIIIPINLTVSFVIFFDDNL